MPADALDMTFKALGRPHAARDPRPLALGETSVQELGEAVRHEPPGRFPASESSGDRGLVTRGRSAQWRPCRLEPKALKEATEWLDQYRQFWEESFGKLDLYLKDIQSKETDT